MATRSVLAFVVGVCVCVCFLSVAVPRSCSFSSITHKQKQGAEYVKIPQSSNGRCSALLLNDQSLTLVLAYCKALCVWFHNYLIRGSPQSFIFKSLDIHLYFSNRKWNNSFIYKVKNRYFGEISQQLSVCIKQNKT